MTKAKIDIKQIAIIGLPIILGLILFLVFFAKKSKSEVSTIQKENTELLIPNVDDETIAESKTEMYQSETQSKLKEQREIEASREIRSSDFFKELSSDDTKPKGSLAEMYEQQVAAPAKTETRSSTSGKKNNFKDEFNRDWRTVVADSKAHPEESHVEKMYNEAIKPPASSSSSNATKSTVAAAPGAADPPQEEAAVPNDGKRRRSSSAPASSDKNLTAAVIHGDQDISSGNTVRMRLTEDLTVKGGVTIPKNTLFYGIGKIGSDRLSIVVENIKYNDAIYPFKCTIYDNDAIAGLNLPSNIKQELSRRSKEGAIDNLSVPSTGEGGMVGTVLTSGVSAVKSALRRNESQIKVSLKANYKIFLSTK